MKSHLEVMTASAVSKAVLEENKRVEDAVTRLFSDAMDPWMLRAKKLLDGLLEEDAKSLKATIRQGQP